MPRRPLTNAELAHNLRSLEFARLNGEITPKVFNQQAGKIRAEFARRETSNAV